MVLFLFYIRTSVEKKEFLNAIILHKPVEGGHRGIIFDRLRGILPDIKAEGTHFLLPWVQKPVIFDVRTRPRNISTTTGSKDMQTVSLTLRVLSRPDTEKLPTIYSNLGLDYDDRVLPSIGNEVCKNRQVFLSFCGTFLFLQASMTVITHCRSLKPL